MRISDWSSDVCSSDLAHPRVRRSYVPRAAAGQDQLLHEVYGRGSDLGRLDDGDRPDRYGFPELSPAGHIDHARLSADSDDEPDLFESRRSFARPSAADHVFGARA